MEMFSLDTINIKRKELLSSALTFLKFPLAILVVILHADYLTKPMVRLGIENLAMSDPLYTQISWFFSKYLAYAAVPAFFVISGFLLFYNVTVYNFEVYKTKLIKRIHTLIIPYISWNLIYLIAYYLVGFENILFYEGPDLFDGSLSPLQFIFTLFIKPLDGPLWFIRNLFAMVVVSPILYWIIKKTKILLPLSLFVISQLISSPLVESFLWFSLGIYFAVCKFDFLYFCRRSMHFTIVVCAIVVIVDYILFPKIHYHISRHFSIFKIMAIFGIGYWVVENWKNVANNCILNNSTFVIFAYHGFAVFYLMPLIYQLIGGKTILAYVLSVTLIVVIGIVLSVLINRHQFIRRVLVGR